MQKIYHSEPKWYMAQYVKKSFIKQSGLMTYAPCTILIFSTTLAHFLITPKQPGIIYRYYGEFKPTNQNK